MTPEQHPPGPLAPRSTLELDRALPGWDGLTRAFAAVLAYAERWVGRALEEPAKAVHEYRKSIRRARALVRLVRPLLRRARYEELDGALRQAVLETSFVRDAEVLRETVTELPDTPALAAAAARLRELVEAQAAACGPERVAELLRRSAAGLATVQLRLAKALPSGVDADDLEEALRESFRRVRACREAATLERTDDAIHDWRKRVKELRYQLELLEVEPAHGPSREAALGELAKELGRITDLMVLRATVRTHEASLGPEHAGALVGALDALIPPRFAAVAEAARPFFDVKARAFARVVLGRAAPPEVAPVDALVAPVPGQPLPPLARPGAPGVPAYLAPALPGARPALPWRPARIPGHGPPALN